MKKTFSKILVVATTMLFLPAIYSGCNSTLSDADIKVAVEAALKADPMGVNTKVDVNEGVATISGECMDDACRAHCANLVEKIEGVKSVVNNCTVATPTGATGDNKAVNDSVNKIMEKYTSVKATVDKGVIILLGNLSAADNEKMMNELKAVNSVIIDNRVIIDK